LWLVHHDENVARWYGGPLTREEAARRAAEFGDGWRTRGAHKWMAYDRESSAVIGRGGVSWVHVEGAERLEVGWALRDRYQGHGYATEIGAAALAYAFDELGVAEVVAYTDVDNVRSRAVMDRLALTYSHDFEHEGATCAFYVRRASA
jgi:RimJ/RimL family protein N-acetyltransferase